MRFVVAPMKHDTGLVSSLRFLRSLAARVYTLTEMATSQTRTDNGLAKHVFGALYRFLFREVGPHSAEIPLILRKSPFVHVEHFTLHPLSPNIGAAGAGNDRWLSELRVRVFGRVWTIFGTHLDAEIQNHDPKSADYGKFFAGNPRWQATAVAVANIQRRLRAAQANSDAVLFGGDTNTLPVGEGLTDPASIYHVLTQLGFKWDNERVTTVGWWGTKRTEHRVVQPRTGEWRSDHALLVSHFSRPKRNGKR